MKISIKDFPVFGLLAILNGLAFSNCGNLMLFEEDASRMLSDFMFGAGLLLVIVGVLLMIYSLIKIKEILDISDKK